ncbi:MAG: NAD(P)/FAD-dependent oxidoreductase [Akkermansiaceae bacterium]
MILIGGGLAGLSCAVRLMEGGARPLLLEASDGVGGRVRTDQVGGFQLDRGFQVYLSAYPEAGRMLNLEALNLQRFRAGALVFKNGKLRRLMDVFRHPKYLLESALAPIGNLADKLRVAKLRFQKPDEAAPQDKTTEEFLRDFGFSKGMIDGFFRAFYGGIFLERDLRTSSRMFEFTFRMFTEGYATLPAKGMQAIPDQLASRLPPGSIRLNAPVRAVSDRSVILESGEMLTADAVVIATDATTAARLLPDFFPKKIAWRAVTAIYFSAQQSPMNEAIIALNGSAQGQVNNVCVLSDVAPEYAPPRQSLISVSVLGAPEEDDLEATVLTELESWFGPQVREWSHLRTDRIRHALPEQPITPLKTGVQRHHGVFVCGDHCTSASIEGAIVSGIETARSILTSTDAAEI